MQKRLRTKQTVELQGGWHWQGYLDDIPSAGVGNEPVTRACTERETEEVKHKYEQFSSARICKSKNNTKNTFSMVINISSDLSHPRARRVPKPSSEAGRVGIVAFTLPGGRPGAGRLKILGSQAVAEPDLDLCPLPPGLRTFLLDMTDESYYKAEEFASLIL